MKGYISIGKFMNSDDPQPIHIELEDELSGINFVNIYMGLKDFANVITGQGYVNCEFKIRGTELVGKLRESKEELITLPPNFSYDKELAQELITPYEIDGWKGEINNLDNYHNRSKGGKTCRVLFVRWIEK